MPNDLVNGEKIKDNADEVARVVISNDVDYRNIEDLHNEIHTAMTSLNLSEGEVLTLVQEFEDDNGHVDLDGLHQRLKVGL